MNTNYQNYKETARSDVAQFMENFIRLGVKLSEVEQTLIRDRMYWLVLNAYMDGSTDGWREAFNAANEIIETK